MSEWQIWRPSILDETCRSMVISTSWVYRIHLDKMRLQNSILHLLTIYPVLGGKVDDGNVIFPSGDIQFEYSKRKGSIENVIGSNKLPKKYEAGFSVRKMLKGRFPLISIKVIDLDDGSVLSLMASHLLMDGRCFYRIANTLLAFYSGKKPASDILFDDGVVPGIQLSSSIDATMFYPIPKSALLSVIWKNFHRAKKSKIFVSGDEIMRIKGKTGASRTAVLSAKVYEIMGRKAISIVQTADHRGHTKEIPSSYGGNAASPLSPIFLNDNLSTEDAARIIDEGIRSNLKNDENYFPAYLFLLKNRLPYLPFPLKAAWNKNPECIICNSFISFGIYEEMAADGSVPSFAFPPDLPDPIRFFPAPPEENGIYILLNL